MKTIILGLGVQGRKRKPLLRDDFYAYVDPFNDKADFKSAYDVPLEKYKNAMLCIPDNAKVELIKYFLKNKKNVLVEKPLTPNSLNELIEIKNCAEQNLVTCYTAYNHRFEPHIKKMKKLIHSGKLGKIYNVRLFYGNGTARLVKDSIWRDQEMGVLKDLGSHLLDMTNFWLGYDNRDFKIISANKFENKSYDHVILHSKKEIDITLEMTLLSWKNNFQADVFGEKGSAHIQSLCKWGPSSFIHNERKYPSGIPNQETNILVQSDPTWQEEYNFFKEMCLKKTNNLTNDIDIFKSLSSLT
jgi:scyllo-inositol 2-dehydrogenase (NADP+)